MEEEEQVFSIVEKMPVFKGCETLLLEEQQTCTEKEISTHLVKNIIYPEIAKNEGVSGKVFLEFVINKEGHIEQVIVLRSVDPLLDNEATRVIKSMPKFQPVKQRERAVNVKYVVPVNFRLD